MSLPLSLLVAVLSFSKVNSQALGDPEALTGSNFNKPTQSFTPFQGPKPTYAIDDLPDQYFGPDGGGNPDSQDQFGFNRCARNAWNQESKCQTAWVNSLEDFVSVPEDNGFFNSLSGVSTPHAKKACRRTRFDELTETFYYFT